MSGQPQFTPSKQTLIANLKAEIGRQEQAGRCREPKSERQFSLGLAEVPQATLDRAALHEVVAAEHRDKPSAMGFLTALVSRLWQVDLYDRRPLLWCALEQTEYDFGNLYGPGLAAMGLSPERFFFVTARKLQDMLWAMEEGLKCQQLSAVIGVTGKQAAGFDLTSSRRLHLAAEASGVTAFVLSAQGPDGVDSVTAARSRWRISAERGLAPDWHQAWGLSPSRMQSQFSLQNHGIGRPCWRVELEKCRGGKPGTWTVEWDYEAHRFRLAAPVVDRPLLPVAQPGEEGRGRIVQLGDFRAA